MSNAQFRTLAALGIYGDKDGWCYPKLMTLAKLLGKSKQAVSKDIQALVELGYIEVTPQYREDGGRQNNLYRLIFDTRQRGIDTPQDSIDTPSTSEVDTPSTSEVDALTTHINAPMESFLQQHQGNVFDIYQSEIGALSPFVSDELQDLEKEYSLEWFVKAVKVAKCSTTRVNLNYIRAILDRWKAEGLPNDNGNGKKPRKKKGKALIQLSTGEVVEASA